MNPEDKEHCVLKVELGEVIVIVIHSCCYPPHPAIPQWDISEHVIIMGLCHHYVQTDKDMLLQ